MASYPFPITCSQPLKLTRTAITRRVAALERQPDRYFRSSDQVPSDLERYKVFWDLGLFLVAGLKVLCSDR